MDSHKTNETTLSRFIGWFGTATGLGGAVLLALNISCSGWGYILFLASSCTLLLWSIRHKLEHQITLQGGFTIINALGVYRWLLA
jgi:hypothetical protein